MTPTEYRAATIEEAKLHGPYPEAIRQKCLRIIAKHEGEISDPSFPVYEFFNSSACLRCWDELVAEVPEVEFWSSLDILGPMKGSLELTMSQSIIELSSWLEERIKGATGLARRTYEEVLEKAQTLKTEFTPQPVCSCRFRKWITRDVNTAYLVCAACGKHFETAPAAPLNVDLIDTQNQIVFEQAYRHQ